jgi:hypothetical protein
MSVQVALAYNKANPFGIKRDVELVEIYVDSI